MRTHPELYLPEAKEQPFFTVDAAYEEGWDSFAAVAFHGAPSGRLYGKITPHYMGGPVAWRDATAAAEAEPASVVTARRIARAFPDVQADRDASRPGRARDLELLADELLGDDERTLDEALDEELSADALEAARARPTDGHQHIVASEYGRVLDAYLRFFPREQLFVGSVTVMDRDPMALLGDLWRFLGVDDSHVPPEPGHALPGARDGQAHPGHRRCASRRQGHARAPARVARASGTREGGRPGALEDPGGARQDQRKPVWRRADVGGARSGAGRAAAAALRGGREAAGASWSGRCRE